MADRCFETEDFPRLVSLPDGHPDLAHLEACPKCRAELDLYRGFMDRTDVPVGADPDDARDRLTAFLAEEIGGVDVPPKVIPLPKARLRPDVRRWSPVLVAACLVCVAIFVRYGENGRMDGPSGVVRESLEAPAAIEAVIAPASGGVRLSWTGPADATGYQVVIKDAAMTEVARLTPGAVGTLDLRTADHAWMRDGAGPFFWYVAAFRDGDEIARTSLRALETGS